MPTSEESEAGFVALLGDLVKSREHLERSRLQQRLKAALTQANRQIRAVQPLSITIGDEFQGLYGTVAAAAEASLLVRLALIEEGDVRFGIGWGPLTRFSKQRAPFEQDGPAWWAAREAIDRAVMLVGQRESPRGVRTVFVSAASENVGPRRMPANEDVSPAPDDGLDVPRPLRGDWQGTINSFLVCRDELVSAMSDRDVRILRGLWAGESLSAIAGQMGITVSAVSQRAVRSGVYAVRHAHEELRKAMT